MDSDQQYAESEHPQGCRWFITFCFVTRVGGAFNFHRDPGVVSLLFPLSALTQKIKKKIKKSEELSSPDSLRAYIIIYYAQRVPSKPQCEYCSPSVSKTSASIGSKSSILTSS